MVYKRAFGDGESIELPCKYQRQLDYSNQSILAAPFSDDFQKPPSLEGEGGGSSSRRQGDETVGEDGEAFSKSQAEENFGCFTEVANGNQEKFETRAEGRLPSFSWVSNCTSREEFRSEAAVRILFSSGFSEAGCPVRTFLQHDEIHTSVFDHPPRRLIPVGEDHQAIIPACGLHCIKSTLECLDNSPNIVSLESAAPTIVVEHDHSDKLVGSCVVPMPDSEASSDSTGEVGNGRANCSCSDEGSIRCVRQHIMESREKLREAIGQESFSQLGFYGMGEIVSGKWTEEEEQLFHNIIFANPSSMGKNFWDLLSLYFPTRTKMEIVSYYFNVFMLRKRAEQNRMDPVNIDSDNDEWQSSDDGDYEFGMTEEDEDSVVESHADQEDTLHSEDHEEHFHEADEDEEEICHNNVSEDVEDEEIEGVSVAHTEELLSNGCGDPTLEVEGKNLKNGVEEHDVQDDSCTSYEGQPSGADSSSPTVPLATTEGCRDGRDQSKSLLSNYAGVCGYDHGLEMEHCDAKIWNVGYLTAPDADVDLLPTCNMIKEVFGEEDWNNKVKDGKGTR